MSEELALRPATGPEKISPEQLLQQAIAAGLSVETIERLVAMREHLRSERARQSYIDSMAAFQSECPTIKHNKTAEVRSGGQIQYRYSYATLDEIVSQTSALREKHGFSYRFNTEFTNEPEPAEIVRCVVSHRDGHGETSEFRSPIDKSARMNAMQQSASSVTYAKRYAFCNAFGIVTADQDNDGGAGEKQQKRTKSTDPKSESPADHVEREGNALERRETAWWINQLEAEHRPPAGKVRTWYEIGGIENVRTIFRELHAKHHGSADVHLMQAGLTPAPWDEEARG